MTIQKVKEAISQSIQVKQRCLEANTEITARIAELLTQAFKNNKKLLICGNGGSAADSQHIAAEFVSRYLIERPALPAIALSCNTSSLTAIGNDYGYEFVFSRQIEAYGAAGDILWVISTSGNSQNIIKAIDSAHKKSMVVVGMTGENGGKMKGLCDEVICVPSQHTPCIQECHITLGHIICEIVENNLFR